MFNFKIVEGRNKKKDKFEIFFICYFVILLLISLFLYLSWWRISGFLWFLFVLSWIIFLLLFHILIIIEFSDKWIWTLNRVWRQMKVSSYRHSSSSLSDPHIIVQYNPPKWINSAEAWLLLHRYASSIEYFSLLYSWSAKKIINIKSEIRDWSEYIIINKVSELPLDTPLYQVLFFNNLFWNTNECCLSELSEIHNYYDSFDLEKYWISKWWFMNNELLWFRISSWKNFIFFCLFLFVLYLKINVYVLIFFVLYYLYKKFRRLKRTKEWDKLVEHLLWFRKFVLSCDEKKFESFLKEDPLYYDEILSYAVVFWIETNLMKKLIPVLDKDIVPEDGTYWTWESIGKFKK